jgi:hypothetical protein
MVVKTKSQTTNMHAMPIRYVAKPQFREAESQTPAELMPEPEVLVINDKTGIDASTQLDEGVLFDFDEEVDPIVERIVSQVLETAKIEAQQEMHMDRLRLVREEYEKKRQSELDRIRTLEQEEIRKNEERIARITQERAALSITKSALEKTKTVKFAKTLLGNVCQSALDSLTSEGLFRPQLYGDIVNDFIPDLIMAASESARRKKFEERLEWEFNRIRTEYVPGIIHEAKKLTV